MSFGERLKRSIKERGLTQQELADKIFITANTVNKWCNGKCNPSIDYLKIICKELEISADWLLGIKDEK